MNLLYKISIQKNNLLFNISEILVILQTNLNQTFHIPGKMSITVAVMQPYFLPYIGYFQLINAADKFVLLDDVNYIKKGWINRNRILINRAEHLFVIPLEKSSQNKVINTLKISGLDEWRKKFLKTVSNAYSKAPHFKTAYVILEEVLDIKTDELAELIRHSIKVMCRKLSIKTEIIDSSSVFENKDLRKQERILDIVKKSGGDAYINPIGGVELYSRDVFKENGIKLNFLKTKKLRYKQSGEKFIEGLSILDVMMFNSKPAVKKMLKEYVLLD